MPDHIDLFFNDDQNVVFFSLPHSPVHGSQYGAVEMTPIILAVTTVIYFFTESKNSQKQKSSIVMKFRKNQKSRQFEI